MPSGNPPMNCNRNQAKMSNMFLVVHCSIAYHGLEDPHRMVCVRCMSIMWNKDMAQLLLFLMNMHINLQQKMLHIWEEQGLVQVLQCTSLEISLSVQERWVLAYKENKQRFINHSIPLFHRAFGSSFTRQKQGLFLLVTYGRLLCHSLMNPICVCRLSGLCLTCWAWSDQAKMSRWRN